MEMKLARMEVAVQEAKDRWVSGTAAPRL